MNLFKIEHQIFDEVKIISAKGFPDDRGYLVVSYLEDFLVDFFIPNKFIREMHTHSKKSVLRGIHFQMDPPMGKLIQVIHGSVFAAVVDVRVDSHTFLGHHTFELSDVVPSLVWIPSGFALGYYTLEPDTIVHYKCDAYIGADRAIIWNDPDIDIQWPTKNPILSERDTNARAAREMWPELWRIDEKGSNSVKSREGQEDIDLHQRARQEEFYDLRRWPGSNSNS